jgi:hypothetical protein
MKMRARVRATHVIDFEHDVPDLAHEAHPRARTSTPGQVAVNDREATEARVAAGREAERLAAERFPDAVEILVEEVTEA